MAMICERGEKREEGKIGRPSSSSSLLERVENRLAQAQADRMASHLLPLDGNLPRQPVFARPSIIAAMYAT